MDGKPLGPTERLKEARERLVEADSSCRAGNTDGATAKALIAIGELLALLVSQPRWVK